MGKLRLGEADLFTVQGWLARADSKSGALGISPAPTPRISQSRVPAVGGQEVIPSRSFLSGKLSLRLMPLHPQVLALPLGWGQSCRRVQWPHVPSGQAVVHWSSHGEQVRRWVAPLSWGLVRSQSCLSIVQAPNFLRDNAC